MVQVAQMVWVVHMIKEVSMVRMISLDDMHPENMCDL